MAQRKFRHKVKSSIFNVAQRNVNSRSGPWLWSDFWRNSLRQNSGTHELNRGRMNCGRCDGGGTTMCDASGTMLRWCDSLGTTWWWCQGTRMCDSLGTRLRWCQGILLSLWRLFLLFLGTTMCDAAGTTLQWYQGTLFSVWRLFLMSLMRDTVGTILWWCQGILLSLWWLLFQSMSRLASLQSAAFGQPWQVRLADRYCLVTPNCHRGLCGDVTGTTSVRCKPGRRVEQWDGVVTGLVAHWDIRRRRRDWIVPRRSSDTSTVVVCRDTPHHSSLSTLDSWPNIVQHRKTLLKAKYRPRVAAASCTSKRTPENQCDLDLWRMTLKYGSRDCWGTRECKISSS